MIVIQLSSAKGPAECCLAVSKALNVLLKEAKKSGLDIQMLEEEPGSKPHTLKSVLLSVEGINALSLSGVTHFAL